MHSHTKNILAIKLRDQVLTCWQQPKKIHNNSRIGPFIVYQQIQQYTKIDRSRRWEYIVNQWAGRTRPFVLKFALFVVEATIQVTSKLQHSTSRKMSLSSLSCILIQKAMARAWPRQWRLEMLLSCSRKKTTCFKTKQALVI